MASFYTLGSSSSNRHNAAPCRQHEEELGIGPTLGTRGGKTDLPGGSISCSEEAPDLKNGRTWGIIECEF